MVNKVWNDHDLYILKSKYTWVVYYLIQAATHVFFKMCLIPRVVEGIGTQSRPPRASV